MKALFLALDAVKGAFTASDAMKGTFGHGRHGVVSGDSGRAEGVLVTYRLPAAVVHGGRAVKGPLPTLTVVMEAFTTFVIATVAAFAPPSPVVAAAACEGPFPRLSRRNSTLTYFRVTRVLERGGSGWVVSGDSG
ncbi:hypothetical protein B1H26_05005 [Amycolatopsis sp. BJA-103]|nr:hypothetical protein BKN51_27450 [Amycolatopsis sp. BJA-103]PNE21168.1 hypothetical protein B1H26_05005 [Amycolatopsis sp. BJA-103]